MRGNLQKLLQVQNAPDIDGLTAVTDHLTIIEEGLALAK